MDTNHWKTEEDLGIDWRLRNRCAESRWLRRALWLIKIRFFTANSELFLGSLRENMRLHKEGSACWRCTNRPFFLEGTSGGEKKHNIYFLWCPACDIFNQNGRKNAGWPRPRCAVFVCEIVQMYEGGARALVFHNSNKFCREMMNWYLSRREEVHSKNIRKRLRRWKQIWEEDVGKVYLCEETRSRVAVCL